MDPDSPRTLLRGRVLTCMIGLAFLGVPACLAVHVAFTACAGGEHASAEVSAPCELCEQDAAQWGANPLPSPCTFAITHVVTLELTRAESPADARDTAADPAAPRAPPPLA